MIRERSLLQRIGDSARRNERAWILAYLALVAVALAGIGVFGVLMGGAQTSVRAWGDRWLERVERAEATLATGDLERAVAQLEELDRTFPARTARHRFDRERERVLALLGRAYLEQDRKGRALDTLRRLVAFDPRNFENHHELALACAHFGEVAEERAALEALLAIHPAHLPSVRRSIELASEAGRFDLVVQHYRDYLDAYVLVPVTVAVDAAEVTVEVPADGLHRDLEAPLASPREPVQRLCLRTGGFSVEVEDVAVVSAPLAGKAGRQTEMRPGEQAAWEPTGLVAAPDGPEGAFAATETASELCRAFPGRRAALSQLRLRMRLFKPVDAACWQLVEKSYRNLSDHEGLERARGRTVIGGSADAIAGLAE